MLHSLPSYLVIVDMTVIVFFFSGFCFNVLDIYIVFARFLKNTHNI